MFFGLPNTYDNNSINNSMESTILQSKYCRVRTRLKRKEYDFTMLHILHVAVHVLN